MTDETDQSNYPESDKFKKMQEFMSNVREFLEYADSEHNASLFSQGNNEDKTPSIRIDMGKYHNAEKIALEMFEVNETKLEDERRDMLSNS